MAFPRVQWEALRFVPFYVGINLVGGIHLPFFPSWLASEGFSPESIGLLMMVMGMIRVVTGPLAGFAADVSGRRRGMLSLLMVATCGAYLGYMASPPAAAIVLLSILASAAFSAVNPLIEGVTLKTALEKGFDYGRVRLCGSAAFIVMNFAGGVALAQSGIGLFLPILAAAGVYSLLATFLLPGDRSVPAAEVRGGIWAHARDLALNRVFMLFVVSAGLAQACHAFYYGFGTLNWKALDYSADLIGFLWAIGVLAEILLFSMSNRIVARFGPVPLLVMGAASGILRWTLMALSPPLWLLIPVQCLHAGTFGAAHLGAMHFLARAVPPQLLGTAQSIYAVSMAVFLSLGQFASGHLFADVGALGYLLMTAMSFVAMVLALQLRQHWDGGRLRKEGLS